MSKSSILKMLAIFAIASMILTACGGGGAEPAATEPAATGPKVTSTGFECPEPNPRVEVTSTELNMFVWTEYFPQDMLDCFELVYDIKLNRDEYSSNGEMYAKVSAGGTAYDLGQPTDYIVPLMIRQGLLQELDHAQMPNMKNFDEGWMDQDFDPGNKYSVPYWLVPTRSWSRPRLSKTSPRHGRICGSPNTLVAWSSLMTRAPSPV